MRFDPARNIMLNSITIHVSLLMYGDTFLFLGKQENGSLLRFISIADGGTVVSEGEYAYPDVDFSILAEALCKIDFPEKQDQNDSLYWEVKCEGEDKKDSSLTLGTWGRNKLKEIIDSLHGVLGSDLAFKEIKEMCNV